MKYMGSGMDLIKLEGRKDEVKDSGNYMYIGRYRLI